MSTKIETLIKRVSKWSDNHYFKKHTLWFDGKNTIIQDFSVIVFKADKIIPPVEFGEASEELIKNAMNHFNKELDKELELPSLKELKNDLKALVGKNRNTLVTYDFDDSGDLPRVNARYLIHMMEGLDVYRITCGTKIQPIKLYGKMEMQFYYLLIIMVLIARE